MSFFRNRLVVALLAATFALPAIHAATPQINVRPQARIVTRVDNTRLVARTNSHPARVSTLADAGRVPAGTLFQHIFLTLKSTDEQEFALHSLLDSQQDKGSSTYHQWMTPETFGQFFGPAPSDIAKVTAWLQDSGFSVEQVTKSGRFIEFSGTAATLEAAFHTEMHQYTVDGELRISNATDISIPAALEPVVLGPFALNNLQAKPRHLPVTRMVKGADGQFHPEMSNGPTADFTVSPNLTTGGGSHFIGGADFPILFDSKPLLAAGINGAGIKIGILGQTDVLLGDIQTYRSVFGLPPSSPNLIQVGNDPGFIADDVESDLDLEVSGAFAPGATIDFYTSGNSYFGGGVAAGGIKIIESNSDDIISISYGFGCEQNLSSGELASLSFMWEQASSQGISVFVSSGDSGPDDCQNGRATGNIYSVDGLSSPPYDVAVGGTMFAEGTTPGTTAYWGPPAGLPYATALSYIPEVVWNEGTLDPYGNVGYGGIVGGTSGVSLVYQTPSWQTGPGVPTTDPTPPRGALGTPVVPGPHRYVPDVSLAAAGAHDGTVLCSEANCLLDSNGNLTSFYLVGGTSIAAPSMAGVQALIDQQNGGRQGLPNYYYYRLAAAQSLTNCNAATLPSAAGATCAFHDVQTGNNFIPSAAGGTVANGNYIGWSANPGYDLTVGLGSPDIYNVATQWKNVTFNATTTAFTLTPTTGPTGQAESFTVKVSPVSGTGTPTGQVSIIAQALNGGLGFVTLAAGSASGTFSSAGLEALPGGTYNVYAHYAGDVTYGGSNSASVSVTIGPSATSIVNTSYLLATNGGLTATTTYQYGQNVYIDSSVCNPAGIAAGGCNTGTPTGAITYTLVNGATTLPSLVSPLDPYNDAYFDAGVGYAGYDIKPNYPSVAAPHVLSPGTYTVNTSYNGDTTFNASTGTPFTITVGPATEAITLTTSTADITSGATVILNASMATLDIASGGVAPTGTVTFTDTTTGTVLGTATLTNGAVVFSVTGKITTPGAHLINAVYSGDTNYAAATSANVTVTVTTGTATPVTIATTVNAVPATTSQVGQTVSIIATLPATATGTVYFYDGAVLLGTATVSTTTHLATLNYAIFMAATHTLTATYGGNATLASGTSAPTTYIVSKNTPTMSLAAQSTAATTSGVALNAVLVPTPNNSTREINPPPTGSVNFLDGATVLGSAPVTYYSGLVPTFVAAYTTAALKPGPHVLSGQYPGDNNYAGATSNTETINIGLTTTSITSSTTSVGTGILFTLTAKITALVANTAPIGGTVTFYDNGTTVIGTATVVNGVATLTNASLSGVGTHVVTAVYSGDANYYTSSSTSSITITTVTPSFSLSVNPTSLTIVRGASGTATLTATSVGNYSGTGPLSCSGLPANANCTFIVSPFTFNGVNGSQSTTLTITTLKGSAGITAGFAGIGTKGLLWIPAMLFAGLLMLRRRQLTARGRQLMVMAILLCSTLAVSGCSGNAPSTPTGTYTVTITANGIGSSPNGASPNIQPTATLTLIVQ